MPVDPGCMSNTKQMPIAALKNEVSAKYISVRIAIRPLIFAFKLAEPVIKLDMINGSINNFNKRMNNSPGYDMRRITSELNLNGRREKPACNFSSYIYISYV